jgi:hypothetical protein
MVYTLLACSLYWTWVLLPTSDRQVGFDVEVLCNTEACEDELEELQYEAFKLQL